ncbi:MAG: RluA family pseudouridine synthase [SAR324 cluster bacterium]|nr:RluA family pseudouridine synthase [SAR324 cluster bacterium]
MTFVLVVGGAQSPIRLDKFLASQDKVVSREVAKKMIKQRLIKLNGESSHLEADTILKKNDRLECLLLKPEKFLLSPIKKPIEIHYEDNHLLVVYKPAGVVTHPSVGHFDESFTHYLAAHTQLAKTDEPLRPGIVHRLDKDTSGLLVVAKSIDALTNLSKQFAIKTAKRSYYAIIWGTPNQLSGVIDQQIKRHAINRKKMTVVASRGKRAITHWEVVDSMGMISLLKCELETGRTHQIRVHLKFIGLPVVGDQTYGKKWQNTKQLTPKQKDLLLTLNYQCLHAFRLGFVHPTINKPMVFSRDMPSYMKHI